MFKNLNDWMIATYVGKREDFRETINRLMGNERGAGTVEYAMIIAVIVVMIIAAAMTMEGPAKEFFKGVIEKVKKAAGI
ncbi:MAG: hypothetical protein Q7U02_03940 [Desulfosalsimonadaceae bacterium]|nr:hypothetical protein [Desulfosalsimonadaceae bacterium]